MRIVLLGAPGAGKGTQCMRIVDKYNLLHLSSGDILRQERADNTELGKKAQSYMDSGALVPDELIVKMMAGAISNAPDGGFVLDGFPRTVNQAAELDKALEAAGQKIDVVLNLVIDDQIVVDRITGRSSCPVCGSVYHVVNMKPKEDGLCDKGCGQLTQRPDDTEEVVKNRLANYHSQTEPVVGYYKDSIGVCDFDAAGAVDDISGLVFKKLDSLS